MLILFFTLTAGAALALYSGDKNILQWYTVASGAIFSLITLGAMIVRFLNKNEGKDEKIMMLVEQNIKLQKQHDSSKSESVRLKNKRPLYRSRSGG